MPAQCPSFHYTRIYERAQQWLVSSRGRQVRVISFLRGGAHVIGSVTGFDDPLQRIRTGQFAQVSILLGNMQDDGTIFKYNTSETLSTFLADLFGSLADTVSPTLVRALYPGLTDPQIIAAVERDVVFRWCVHSLL